jgi:hypothetical protein
MWAQVPGGDEARAILVCAKEIFRAAIRIASQHYDTFMENQCCSDGDQSGMIRSGAELPYEQTFCLRERGEAHRRWVCVAALAKTGASSSTDAPIMVGILVIMPVSVQQRPGPLAPITVLTNA